VGVVVIGHAPGIDETVDERLEEGDEVVGVAGPLWRPGGSGERLSPVML
jgi:hypothetical protein